MLHLIVTQQEPCNFIWLGARQPTHEYRIPLHLSGAVQVSSNWQAVVPAKMRVQAVPDVRQTRISANVKDFRTLGDFVNAGQTGRLIPVTDIEAVQCGGQRASV